jgi:AcrR family transcriptional regulator
MVTGSTKRLGTQKSATRALLIDAAEQLIVEEGYAAVTTRRLADKANVKFQLIYYYFNTLEDLLLEVVERNSQRKIERLEEALAQAKPLRAIWERSIDPATVTGINGELIVLAKQYDRVRAAIAENSELLRAMEVEALTRYLAAHEVDLGMSALDFSMLLTSIARTLRLERTYGMSLGHDNLEKLVETWLEKIEDKAAGAPAPVLS